MKSDYINEEGNINGKIGYNAGVYNRIQLNGFSIRNFLNYQLNRSSYQPEIVYLDAIGISFLEEERKINNQYLSLSTIITLDLNNELYLGTGIGTNYLINSMLVTHEEITVLGKVREKNSKYKNFQYVDFSLFIPLIFGYEWNRSGLYIMFEKGISNRSRKEALQSDIRNLLSIGYTFSINKSSE